MLGLPDWITAISSAIAALGVVFVAYQVRLTSIQIEKDHQRSRQESAIRLLGDWSNFIRDHGSGARAFADDLTEDQTKCLFRVESFDITSKQAGLVNMVLARYDLKLEDDHLDCESIRLTQPQVHSLKRGVSSYLNMLETIMAARRHSVADKNIVKEQFASVCVPNGVRPLLKQFRLAAGGSKTYPALEEFIEEVLRDAQPRKANPPL